MIAQIRNFTEILIKINDIKKHITLNILYIYIVYIYIYISQRGWRIVYFRSIVPSRRKAHRVLYHRRRRVDACKKISSSMLVIR